MWKLEKGEKHKYIITYNLLLHTGSVSETARRGAEGFSLDFVHFSLTWAPVQRRCLRAVMGICEEFAA